MSVSAKDVLVAIKIHREVFNDYMELYTKWGQRSTTLKAMADETLDTAKMAVKAYRMSWEDVLGDMEGEADDRED